MRMSEKCRKNSNKHNNNNSDISMTSRRIDVGKNTFTAAKRSFVFFAKKTKHFLGFCHTPAGAGKQKKRRRIKLTVAKMLNYVCLAGWLGGGIEILRGLPKKL